MPALLDTIPIEDDLPRIIAALETLAPSYGGGEDGAAIQRLGAALVMAFIDDGASPLAYAAVGQLRREAAEATALAVSHTDYVTGAENPAAVSQAVILTIALTTAAAGGLEQADELLRQAMVLRPDYAPFRQAHAWTMARA